jgi:hypothetical protein
MCPSKFTSVLNVWAGEAITASMKRAEMIQTKFNEPSSPMLPPFRFDIVLQNTVRYTRADFARIPVLDDLSAQQYSSILLPSEATKANRATIWGLIGFDYAFCLAKQAHGSV